MGIWMHTFIVEAFLEEWGEESKTGQEKELSLTVFQLKTSFTKVPWRTLEHKLHHRTGAILR